MPPSPRALPSAFLPLPRTLTPPPLSPDRAEEKEGLLRRGAEKDDAEVPEKDDADDAERAAAVPVLPLRAAPHAAIEEGAPVSVEVCPSL